MALCLPTGADRGVIGFNMPQGSFHPSSGEFSSGAESYCTVHWSLRTVYYFALCLTLGACLHHRAFGQGGGQPPAAADLSSSAQQAIALTEQGRCQEALPILRRTLPHLTDKQVRYLVQHDRDHHRPETD